MENSNESQKRRSPSAEGGKKAIGEFNPSEKSQNLKSKSSSISTKYECTPDNPLGLMPLDKLAQLLKEDDEEQLEKEKEKKSKGFFGFSFFSSVAPSNIITLEVTGHITNIST